MTIVTKDSLQALLNKGGAVTMHAVGRALVVLYDNQLQDEKNASTTIVNNGIGFTGADARKGSIAARTYLKYKQLQPWQVEMWLQKNSKGYSRIAKYHRQLNIAAEAKAVRNQLIDEDDK